MKSEVLDHSTKRADDTDDLKFCCFGRAFYYSNDFTVILLSAALPRRSHDSTRMAGETPAIGMPRLECLRRSRPYFGCPVETRSTRLISSPRWSDQNLAACGGIDNQNDTTAAMLQRFAYPFGIEGKIMTRRLGKLRLDETVVLHVERGSHRCLHIVASLAAFSR